MTKARKHRTDKEWIDLLATRRTDETAGAFAHRHEIPYTYIFSLLKRYPEVAKLPAWTNRGTTGQGKKEMPKQRGRPGKVRVLEPKIEKVPKLPEPGKKRMGRPKGSKNKPKPGKQVDKPTPKDPDRSDFQGLTFKSAEALFFQDLSIALKTGRRLRIELQLMPEGA